MDEPIVFTAQLPLPSAIRSIPFEYNSVNKHWTHISFCFEYCGNPTSTFRLASDEAISNWQMPIAFNRMYCDNVSLKENLNTPVITISASPFPIAHQNCPVTLTVSSSCDLCTMSSYKWFVSVIGGGYSQFSATTLPTTTITLPNLTNYSIYVIAANDCSSYTSNPISLSVEVSNLNVSLTTSPEDCHGTKNGTAAITVTPAANIVSVNWYQNGILILTPAPPPFTMAIDKLSADNYSVEVTDNYGCEVVNTFTITESKTELWPYHPFQDGKSDGTAIVLDADANVYTAGIFTDKIIFDANYGFNAGGFTNIFLLKQDKCGYTIWALELPSYSARVNDMVLDYNGNIIIAGKFVRNLSFPGGLMLSSGSNSDQDGFIASFDNTGQFLWARQIDGTSNPDAVEASGVCVDQNNNIYTVGSFNGASIQFLPNIAPIPSLANLDNLNGTNDIWLAKYSNTGTLLNYQSSGTPNPTNTNDYGRSISYCSNCLSGQIAITGSKANRRFWEIYSNNLGFPPAVNTMLPNLGEGTSIHFLRDPYNDLVFLTSLILYSGIPKAVVSKYFPNGIFNNEYICGDITTLLPDKFTKSKYYNGNIYLTGEFADATNYFSVLSQLMSFTNLGSPFPDNVAARLNTNGDFDILVNSEGLSTELSNSIDVDYLNTGNIFYTGCFTKTSILGSHQMDVPPLLTGPDFFIARVINVESIPVYDRPVNTTSSPIPHKPGDQEIQIYPNPSSGIVNIESSLLANKILGITLFNSLGKLVMKTNGVIFSSGTLTLDFGNYPTGMYYLELNDNFNRLGAKFVLTK